MSEFDRLPMTPHTLISQTFLDLPIESKRRVDRICLDFESAGQTARIEEFLNRVDVDLRGALLTELLALELEWRRSASEHPSTADYLNRFPENGDAIRAAFRQTLAPTVGGTLGKYNLIGILGRGGMGVVYEAVDPVIDRKVAIKVLPDRLLSEPQAHDRLLQEARSAGQLLHPNVVALFEVGEADGAMFLVLECVTGGNAAERIKRDGPVDWRLATQIAADVCRGLAAIHAAGFLHLDIKPANILLPERSSSTGNSSTTGTVLAKLSDFSLAVTDEGGQGLRMQAGTPAYMSPEQRTSGPLTQRTDVFGVGASLFALLTGKAPFTGTTVTEIVADQVQHPQPDPRNVNAAIPPRIAGIVCRAMATDPGERYPSAEALQLELEAALVPAKPRSHRRVYAALGVAALASAVGAAALLNRPEADEPQPVVAQKLQRQRIDGWERLLDGHDLTGWRTLVPDGSDSNTPSEFHMVELDGSEVLQASGTGPGSIESEQEFENYHLRFEYRWGTAGGTHLASIRYHCTGAFGSKGTHGMELHALRAGSYIRMNDFLKLDVGEVRGDRVAAAGPGGRTILASGGREVAVGRWNRAALICVDDWSVHVINGVPVLALARSRKVEGTADKPLTRGRIRFQSVKGEIFFRKIEVRKATEIPPEYRAAAPTK